MEHAIRFFEEHTPLWDEPTPWAWMSTTEFHKWHAEHSTLRHATMCISVLRDHLGCSNLATLIVDYLRPTESFTFGQHELRSPRCLAVGTDHKTLGCPTTTLYVLDGPTHQHPRGALWAYNVTPWSDSLLLDTTGNRNGPLLRLPPRITARAMELPPNTDGKRNKLCGLAADSQGRVFVCVFTCEIDRTALSRQMYTSVDVFVARQEKSLPAPRWRWEHVLVHGGQKNPGVYEEFASCLFNPDLHVHLTLVPQVHTSDIDHHQLVLTMPYQEQGLWLSRHYYYCWEEAKSSFTLSKSIWGCMEGPYRGVTLAPDKRLFCTRATSSGTLDVIDPSERKHEEYVGESYVGGRPTGIAINGSGDVLYVVDNSRKNRVIAFRSDRRRDCRGVWGNEVLAEFGDNLSGARGLAWHRGVLFVADCGNARIRVFEVD